MISKSLFYFQYPDLQKVYEVKAHTNEVDDLTISLDGSKVCRMSFTGHFVFAGTLPTVFCAV